MGAFSFEFLALAIVVAICLRSLRWPAARTAVFTLANVAFLASFAAEPLAMVPLAGFLLLGWIAVAALRRRPGRSHLAAWLVAIVVVFAVLKQYGFVKPVLEIGQTLSTVGLSYVLFRVVHLIVDVGTGARLEGLTALRFFNYTTSFLTFESGPIQRFEDHLRELSKDPRDEPQLDGRLLLDVGSRAIVGLVKLLMAAPAALGIHEWGASALQGKSSPLATLPHSAQVSIATLAYLMFLYWNFSGYMDLVISAGRLAGFALPENFQKPFSAPNFIELWSRWHITLSDWFRFYLFNPLVTGLTRFRTDARLAPYYGVLGFLVTFFVMGVWHGTTGIFLFYGLLLGTAMALNKLYQVQMRAWLGKQRWKRLTGNVVYERLCNGACIAFFALALCCFWLEWSGLLRLLRNVGALGVLGGLGVSVVVTVLVRLIHDLAQRLTALPRVDRVLASRWWRQAWTSLVLLILVIHAAATHSDLPPFVYAEF